MKVVDANLLLYAVDSAARHHESARTWLDRSLREAEPIGFAWLVVTAFLRISTHPAIYPSPLSPDEALDIVDAWVSQPLAVALEPTAGHLPALRQLLTSTGAGGNLVNDAHLAALAREHGATVVSYDNDFGRFPGVRWETPAQ